MTHERPNNKLNELYSVEIGNINQSLIIRIIHKQQIQLMLFKKLEKYSINICRVKKKKLGIRDASFTLIQLFNFLHFLFPLIIIGSS